MSGIAQLRSACLYSTTRSFRPLLRATMMYCADSVSSMVVRTRRILVALRMMAIVSDGSTRLAGPLQPDGGNSGNVIDSSSTSISASQKLGKDSPTSDRMRMAWSVALPRLMAAWMPSGSEIRMDANSEVNASISVAGRASPISLATDVPPMKLRPKSPCSSPCM